MPFDLRYEPWIPWRRRGGEIEWGPPALLVDSIEGDNANPIVAIAAPRPDFDGALQEFLIGLLAAALHPEDDDAWATLWKRPPLPAELEAALDRLPAAFNLDGDGPRFFQDSSATEVAEGAHLVIESLLIGAPNTETKGAEKLEIINDLFVKPGRIRQMGRPAAAMAVLTMQTYAPAGGKGHRTSLRGGGPLTTLVDPRANTPGGPSAEEQPLWYKLWANVETQEQLAQRSVPGVPTEVEAAFPWLRPTRTSNEKAGGRPTSAASTHPLMAYFGLPRRIRLVFGTAGTCDLTGRPDEQIVTGFQMRNYGAQYTDWNHPLTPHYRQKVTEPWLPIHGQPGGIGWKDWVGLTLSTPDGAMRRPAAVVPAFGKRVLGARGRAARLHVFGYDFDNMKCRGWTEAEVPLVIVDDAMRQPLLRDTAAQLTDATGAAAAALLYAVKIARYSNPKEVPGDIGHVRTELWSATEAEFYRIMAELAVSEPGGDAVFDEADQRRAAFAGVLRDAALKVFDRWCPIPGAAPEPMRRRVAARYDLTSALGGYSTLGEQIFTALGVPLPGGGRSGRAAKNRAHKEATK